MKDETVSRWNYASTTSNSCGVDNVLEAIHSHSRTRGGAPLSPPSASAQSPDLSFGKPPDLSFGKPPDKKPPQAISIPFTDNYEMSREKKNKKPICLSTMFF